MSLRSLLRNVAGEKGLTTAWGRWMRRTATVVDTNTDDIATNTADIVTNTADIVTNTADIAANTADIATNTADIADIVTDITPDITQAAWAVNDTTGNDSNAGTPAEPLLTLAELQRRFEGKRVTQDTSIALTGTFTEVLVLDCIVPPAVTITVSGGMTTAFSGVVDAFTALNGLTSQDAQMTDATATWATHIKRRLRLTSGASAGAIAWVLKDLGANVARVSQFGTITGTAGAIANPAPADTYVVETFDTSVGGLQIRFIGGGSIVTTDLSFTGAGSTTGYFSGGGNQLAARVLACEFITATSNFRDSYCSFRQSKTDVFFGLAVGIYFTQGNAHFAQVQAQQFGYMQLTSVPSVSQGHRLVVQGGGTLELNTSWGFFDVPNVGGGVAAVTIRMSGASVESIIAGGLFWGIAVTATFGVQCKAGCSLIYTTISTVTGGSDTQIGGVTQTWVAIAAGPGIVTAANNAMIVPHA